MTKVPITEERSTRSDIHRSDLIRSLSIGFLIGLIAGAPLGWFSHRIYSKQRLGENFLCRQRNANLPEAQLNSTCGFLY